MSQKPAVMQVIKTSNRKFSAPERRMVFSFFQLVVLIIRHVKHISKKIVAALFVPSEMGILF